MGGAVRGEAITVIGKHAAGVDSGGQVHVELHKCITSAKSPHVITSRDDGREDWRGTCAHL